LKDSCALYGLGLQGGKGDNTDPEPNMFNVLESQKWKAWESRKGMSLEEA